MFASQSTITNYRGITGRCKRGVLAPSHATLGWIERVRKRADELKPLGEREFLSIAAQCSKRIRTAHDTQLVANVIESFALTEESLRRSTGMSYYDVQLMGGFALSAGTITEIQTGEGKTITTALPAVLHAWTGQGVHIGTTNDYLSKRDHDELHDVFTTLGLTVGHLSAQAPVAEKAAAYACDVTYGPGYEFGFDFLRDQLALRSQSQERLGEAFLRRLQGGPEQQARTMQRGHAFAIIDEADSVLIDEATTPLILSGGKSECSTSPPLYHFARETAQQLQCDHDYRLDPVKRSIELTRAGWDKIHKLFERRPPGQIARPWNHLIENALRAESIFQRDVDYVVRSGEILIVDQNTGRIHEERKWSSGLHQAVEAKEQVDITDENDTHARITRQRFLGFYGHVAGLTGTACDSEAELRDFYQLPVVEIPTHRPSQREWLPLRCFDTCDNKFAAIADDTAQRSRRGQPVLVGTRTIDESKRLSACLTTLQIPHVVLNGLQDEEEAAIVSRAGVSGTVTVATNMAGRGTDIKLDPQSIHAGGLHVAASEINACRRVDRQLAGRAARQGDPGSCQFYVSAKDDLIQSRSPTLANQICQSAGPNGESTADHGAAVRRVQKRAESAALQQRQQMVAHDDWMESVQSSLAKRA